MELGSYGHPNSSLPLPKKKLMTTPLIALYVAMPFTDSVARITVLSGWLFVTKHPESVAREKTTDMSDMQADPIVVFQKR